MKILGVYNIKGGVGKTATAVNLGYLAARQGLRTLIWDLDPQGAASFYFRIKPRIKGSRKLMEGRRDPLEVVKGTDFDRLDLIPADMKLRHMDLMLDQAKKPTLQLLRLLRPLSDEYDLLIMDCPPSISLVSENIFRAANQLLVPTIPTTLSLRTLGQLLDFLQERGLRTPVSLFYSMADRRKAMHRQIMEGPADPRAKTLNAYIPYLSEVERMGLERAPVCSYAPRSRAAGAYQALWAEAARLSDLAG